MTEPNCNRVNIDIAVEMLVSVLLFWTLTILPLCPGAPVSPTEPSVPGDPETPARPSGPAVPLSPWNDPHVPTVSTHSRMHGSISTSYPLEVLPCPLRDRPSQETLLLQRYPEKSREEPLKS